MAGEEEAHFGEGVVRGDAGDVGAREEVAHDAVVGVVGLGFGVVDAGAYVVFNVGAPDEFDGEGPVFPVGGLELVREFVAGGFEVGLQGVVEDGFAVAVVLAHQVDGPAVDGMLEDLLFGVDPDPAVLGSRF